MVVGSSLVVHPAAEMPGVALDAGAKLILINQGETPYDRLAHIIFRESAGEVLEAILAELRRLEGPESSRRDKG
jgi:NAD-dependent deacetylase